MIPLPVFVVLTVGNARVRRSGAASRRWRLRPQTHHAQTSLASQ